MQKESAVFESLMRIIEDRKKNPPARSYTTTLFQGGVDRIGCKVMEEAAEVVRAARQAADSAEARANLVHEAGDVIYHLFVLLGYCDVRLSEVESELAQRFGTSGLDEKASRG
jgi:phosphoribosyl-ATP pyrophosphohydrolase